MATRKTNSTLACGCRHAATKKHLDVFFGRGQPAGTKYKAPILRCSLHGEQKLTSVDGPRSLQDLFKL